MLSSPASAGTFMGSPDLFPATRDTACWRFGIHRPPKMPWDSTVRSPFRLSHLLKQCRVAEEVS